MHTFRRAALSALALLALVGCANTRMSKALSREHAAAIQPVEVKVGIRQPELYADFERSRAGQSAAAACGAVPGIGILLAAACGGAGGAVDSSVNASRAKAADEIVRPLKDEIVDLKFDPMMRDSITQALRGVPGMQLSAVELTKAVDDKAYEQSFRASTSSAVMFINVDYHLSIDFSTLEISARGLLYPRSAAARTAAALSAELPLPNNPQDQVMALNNAVYRSRVIYKARLPVKAEDPATHVAAWKADGAGLLRSGLVTGTAHVTRLLAEDLQRGADTKLAALSQVEVDKYVKADVVAETHGGQLLRYPDGTLHFLTVAAVTAEGTAAQPVAAK